MAYIGRENNGFGVRSRFIYTATGGQTTFNTDDSGNALSYSDGAYVDVYLNGVLLDPADYTDTSLTSIVLGSGATASDILEVIVYDVFSVFSGTFTTGITAGDATITGDLTVDTTLLVGTTDTNPANNGASGDAGVAIANSGYVSAARSSESVGLFNRMDSDGIILLLRKDGADVGKIGNQSTTLFVSSSQAGGLRFTYSGSSPIIAPCDTAGANLDNSADLGFASARFKDLYLGGGAYIGGTGSANKLDDYEEGTFTPTYIGSVSNPTVTYDRQYGHYVKIGRQVIANIELRTDALSGGSSNFYVGGLPFTPVAPTGTTRAGTGHIGYSSSFNDKGPQTAYINGAFNAVILLRSADTDSWGENDTGMASSDFLGGSNGNFLMITAIYTA